MAQTSSIFDHFTIWPSVVTLTFNVPKQIFELNNCAKSFWNPCINVQFMALTSSIHYRFIIWSSSVTLTFNLPEHMFQMALLLLKDTNCAKLFWNPCTNVEGMTRTKPDRCSHNACTNIHQTEFVTTILSFDLQEWHWPLHYMNKCFERHCYSSGRTTLPNYFEIHAQM